MYTKYKTIYDRVSTVFLLPLSCGYLDRLPLIEGCFAYALSFWAVDVYVVVVVTEYDVFADSLDEFDNDSLDEFDDDSLDELDDDDEFLRPLLLDEEFPETARMGGE